MKTDIHPDYHPVVFQDMTSGKRFFSRSTAKSEKTEEIDGVEHYVISMGITSDSHPFFTGKSSFVDTEGRIDKFQKRFGSIRRAKKPSLAPKEEPKAEEKPAENDA
jgi:large subunit ribosomal protein L31